MHIDKYRPIPFFFLTTADPQELTYEKILSSLKKVKADGFGGIILFNKPPHGFSKENYLGPKWFRTVRNFILAAKELSLRFWINDGFNYPPGSAAGRIRDIDDSLSQKRVLLKNGEIVFEEVEWGYPAFELPKSSELFIELVYEAYNREVGEYFGNGIEGFFSDADNRRINSGVWDEHSPERDFFPWSDSFPEFFELQYHYDIREYLPQILNRTPCPQARDYWECASALYQNWFANNYRWMQAHGLKYAFHTSDSSPCPLTQCPRSSVFTEGRALDMAQNCDYPGTDQELLDINANNIFFRETFYEPEISWGSDGRGIQNSRYYDLYGDVRSKQASSAAFLYNKETALCEMFAASNWGATYTDLRAIALWQVMQGIGLIVPHAYHYLLHGNTKYFAPPAFCRYSHLDTGIRQFNDMLASYAAICNEGQLIAPIALLDITEELWKGNDLSRNFLDTAQYLNRSPFGYVIADRKGIERKASSFRVAVNPGIPLSETDLDFFHSRHITVLNYRNLDKLNTLIPTNISFNGEGTPHYMRRDTDRGEILIVANTENRDGVSGTLHRNGKHYELYLELGEMAYFYDTECQYRRPDHLHSAKAICSFSSAGITYLDENILPIERWVNEHYQAIAKNDPANELHFTYTVSSPISNLKLYLSGRHMELISGILADGTELAPPTETKVFDDAYIFFDLSGFAAPRKHKITIRKNGELNLFDRIFLKGDFDVRLITAEHYFKKTGWHYNMYRYIPRLADIFLETPRSAISLLDSWANQGRPFYSGKARYTIRFRLDSAADGFLDLPEVNFTCTVSLDGKLLGTGLWSPYRFDVQLNAGEHELQIEITNTLANSMEFYRAPSGITAPITLYRR